jgi:hypothetical protein
MSANIYVTTVLGAAATRQGGPIPIVQDPQVRHILDLAMARSLVQFRRTITFSVNVEHTDIIECRE